MICLWFGKYNKAMTISLSVVHQTAIYKWIAHELLYSVWQYYNLVQQVQGVYILWLETIG